MANYLQLGHESWNLVGEPGIGSFAGVVLSPVNDGPDEIISRLSRVRETQPALDVVLDPQLYNPAAQRGQLPEWSYYGADFETADRSDAAWWSRRIPEVVKDALRVGATTICSPAPIPRSGDNDYFAFVKGLADEAYSEASRSGLECTLTAIVPLDSLYEPRRAMEIASVLSGFRGARIYLNFLAPDRVIQRQPLSDQASLATAVHLVHLLSRDHRVHVACTSHDVLLWLGAGAADVSTGKYMNVRRFSPSRWMDDQTGGRNNYYWNDDRILTLVREQDVLRLDRHGWFEGRSFSENPSSQAILDILRAHSGAPWQRLSWIQYMRWFANMASEINNVDAALSVLEASRAAWIEIEAAKILFFDSFNDGSHVTCWLNSLNEGLAR